MTLWPSVSAITAPHYNMTHYYSTTLQYELLLQLQRHTTTCAVTTVPHYNMVRYYSATLQQGLLLQHHTIA